MRINLIIPDPHCVIHAINKCEAKNLMQNIDLIEKIIVEHYKTQIFYGI